jgi:hypothetical protein
MAVHGVNIFDKLVSGCHGELRLLIAYGSPSGADADYLAIFDQLPRPSSLMAGALDLWAISEDRFTDFLNVLDPFVTEPLLTGTVAFGSTELFAKLQTYMGEQTGSSAGIRHLLCRSMELFCVACERLSHGDGDSPIFAREFWSGLSFSVSYWAFARSYSRRFQGPMSLMDVMVESPPEVHELWREVRRRKAAGTPRAEDLLNRWGQIFLGNQRFELMKGGANA